MFTIEMLPATNGDCLWIEYGDETSPNRILIDTGTNTTSNYLKEKIEKIDKDQRKFELMIISHIDYDHIKGIIDYFNKGYPDIEFEDIWFNGWRHIQNIERYLPYAPKTNEYVVYGVPQADELSKILQDKDLPWNNESRKKKISLPPDNSLETIKLDGGMKITLLSPTILNLCNLKQHWYDEVKKLRLPLVTSFMAPIVTPEVDLTIDKIEDLAKGETDGDESHTNESSIAILAEYEGKKVLFAADAHRDTLEESLQKVPKTEEKLIIDVFKVSHHGSKENINSSLLELIDCPKFLISTNGSVHHHPDDEAIAKIISSNTSPKTLYFNYATEPNKRWKKKELQNHFGYKTEYGDKGHLKIEVNSTTSSRMGKNEKSC